MALMDDAGLKALTKKTSQKLFSSLKGGPGSRRGNGSTRLAREPRCSSPVCSTAGRSSHRSSGVCAVGAPTALHRPNEVRAHIHAALNVGATRQEVAGGDLPDGHLRRYAGRGRRARGVRAGAGRARRALPGEEPAR
jgi:hypothetical protein